MCVQGYEITICMQDLMPKEDKVSSNSLPSSCKLSVHDQWIEGGVFGSQRTGKTRESRMLQNFFFRCP